MPIVPSKRFKVFIIGPMGKAGQGPGGVPQADHIANIQKAAKQIKQEIDQEFDIDLYVSAPNPETDDYGAIADFAFSNIDNCDFAIADISARSPSVMYELAVLHALGTPYIIFDFAPFDKSKEIYYLNDVRVRAVEDYFVDTLSAQIASALRTYLRDEIGQAGVNFRTNKLSDYFLGVPLVDASAVAGIAAGYMHNFLRHAIADNGPIAREADINRLIVIRPERVREANHSWFNIKRALKEKGLRDGEMLDSPSHPIGKLRTAIYKDSLIDYPTAIESLVHSPSFIRFTRQYGGGDRALMVDFEKKLIDAFFRNLKMLRELQTSIVEEYFVEMTAEQVAEL